jgi:hypothetical protein
MIDPLNHRLQVYAQRWQLKLAEQLGSGMHGIIFSALSKREMGKTAVKAHKEQDPYRREVAAYLRLQDAGVRQLQGFRIPNLVRYDDELMVLEMTTVTRPFVLDFAGAYLDYKPQFSDEIWEEWLRDKMEKFEERWPKVQELLGELEHYGVYMIDVNPGNIGFEIS